VFTITLSATDFGDFSSNELSSNELSSYSLSLLNKNEHLAPLSLSLSNHLTAIYKLILYLSHTKALPLYPYSSQVFSILTLTLHYMPYHQLVYVISLSLSLFLSLSVSYFLPVSLSLCLSFSICLSLFLSVCLFISVCLSLFISVSLYMCVLFFSQSNHVSIDEISRNPVEL